MNKLHAFRAMMKNSVVHSPRVLGLLSLSLGSFNLVAADAHHHGQASLTLARDNQILQIEFSAPVMDLLHAEPDSLSEEQRQKLEGILNHLAGEESLFSLKGGSCNVQHIRTDSPYSNSEHDHKHEHEHEHEHEQHKDIQVSYQLHCESQNPVTELTFTGFATYPHMEKVEVTWLMSSTGAHVITRDNPTLTFN